MSGEKRKSSISICWDCAIDVFKKCEWAHKLKKFEGLKFAKEDGGESGEVVIKCPRYKKDERHLENEKVAFCEVCGARLPSNRTVFCSDACVKKSLRRPPHYCLNCGKTIPSTRKYCNEVCKLKYFIKCGKKKPPKKCLYCGQKLKGKQIDGFCNRFCRESYKKERRKLNVH